MQLWGTGSLFNHVLSDPGEDRLELMALSWTGDDGSVVLKPSAHDFSGRDSLYLYVAIHSANDLNTENESQGFSLVLTDSSGQSQRNPRGLLSQEKHQHSYFTQDKQIPLMRTLIFLREEVIRY